MSEASSTEERGVLGAIYPLTAAQEGILAEAILRPGDTVYVVQHWYRLDGRMETDLFRRAWQTVVDRHAALRTRITWQGGEPAQIAERAMQVPLREHDAREMSAPAFEDWWRREIAADYERGFALDETPLFRLLLVAAPGGEHRLLWTSHHLILDAASRGRVIEELGEIYDALVHDGRQALQDPIDFREYVAWLSERPTGSATRFWRDYLSDFAEPTRIASQAAVAKDDTSAEELVITLPAQRLTSMCRRLRVTLATALFGMWAVALARTTGVNDVVFGATLSTRPDWGEGDCALVGLCINTLPIRTVIVDDQGLGEWLRGLQADVAMARDNAQLPLTTILGFAARDSSVPLFDSLVVYEGEDVAAGTHSLQFIEEGSRATTERPLTIVITVSDRLRISFRHRRSLAATVERLAGHYIRLLRTVAGGMSGVVGDLEMLSRGERQLLLAGQHGPEIERPALCVHALVEDQVRRTPDAIAVVAGRSHLSYGELERRANRLAWRLRELGVAPESLVGVFLERGFEMVVALLAVLKAGGAYVPLDPEYPHARLDYMLADSDASLVLSESGLAERLPRASADVLLLDRDRRSIEACPSQPPAVAVQPANLAYVIYTSGSTGEPKGVAMPHAPLVNLLEWQRLAWQGQPPARTLMFSALAFDVAFQETFSTLMCGGTLVAIDEADRSVTERLWQVVCEQRIECLFMPYVALRELAECAGPSPSHNRLRQVITAGEALQVTDALRTFFAADQPRALWNQYGPTETHVVTESALPAESDTWPLSPPIGAPITGVRTYIVGSNGSLAAAGAPGELCVGGAGVARGYLRRPGLTAERFVPDPFSGRGRRLYRTGDLARWSQSDELEFLGRRDDQVKIRGFRVELGEIEVTLLRQPGVRSAAVVAREDVPGLKRLVAYCVVERGESMASLRAALAAELPDYMVPSAFVSVPELPRTPSGKLDRRALPVPAERPESAHEFVAPRTPLEEVVASVWEELIGVQGIGVHDNFFELGGHSLLVMRIVAKLRSLLSVEVPGDAVFTEPTIAGLAQLIDSVTDSTALISRHNA